MYIVVYPDVQYLVIIIVLFDNTKILKKKLSLKGKGDIGPSKRSGFLCLV